MYDSFYLSVRQTTWDNFRLMAIHNARTTEGLIKTQCLLNEERISRLYSLTVAVVITVASAILYKKLPSPTVGILVGLCAIVPLTRFFGSSSRMRFYDKMLQEDRRNLDFIFNSLNKFLAHKFHERVSKVVQQFNTAKEYRGFDHKNFAAASLTKNFHESDETKTLVGYAEQLYSIYDFPKEIDLELVQKLRAACKRFWQPNFNESLDWMTDGEVLQIRPLPVEEREKL